jgi:hypothetical protein
MQVLDHILGELRRSNGGLIQTGPDLLPPSPGPPSTDPIDMEALLSERASAQGAGDAWRTSLEAFLVLLDLPAGPATITTRDQQGQKRHAAAERWGDQDLMEVFAAHRLRPSPARRRRGRRRRSAFCFTSAVTPTMPSAAGRIAGVEVVLDDQPSPRKRLTARNPDHAPRLEASEGPRGPRGPRKA